MAWLGKVSLGGFSDLAGAVTKLSESVKNIEKNFDSALGLEEKDDAGTDGSGVWASTSESIGLFEPVMAFMGQRGDENASDSSIKEESLNHPSSVEEPKQISTEGSQVSVPETTAALSKEETEEFTGKTKDVDSPEADVILGQPPKANEDVEGEKLNQPEKDLSMPQPVEVDDSVPILEQKSDAANKDHGESPLLPGDSHLEKNAPYVANVLHDANDLKISYGENETEDMQPVEIESSNDSATVDNGQVGTEMDSSGIAPVDTPSSVHINEMSDSVHESIVSTHAQLRSPEILCIVSDSSTKQFEAKVEAKEPELHAAKVSVDTTKDVPVSKDTFLEVEKMKKEMKMMEAALQGAAKQAQAKADEIAKLMTDNEQLKATIEDVKRKSTEAEIDALRDEYHQRVASLERKVYALTKERDTLRREQNKKSDATALLKEKDEIISQVMAEGEELSKKQAAQEATIRKLRAQIREFEEEKQRLNSKLQVEEAKVESIKRDKTATEKLLQETIEKNQAELLAQKEFYASALSAAKEAEALAEARANNEAKIELESRLKEANEREAILVQTLEELRQTLSRTEQQAIFKEEMLRRDIDDIQKRYQASELRYNELITQIPESTRPLLRQIEAMQETAARRAEAWAGVERSLNSRLQEAEAKAAAAEENERTLNDRLSQSLSRITVLETQITCLRTEQTQLSRSLEKERQRASESKQEYLIAKEEAATQKGRARQLEDEIKELRAKHKKEKQEEIARKELLEKELEREKASKAELENSISRQTPVPVNQLPSNNMPVRKLSSTGSSNAIEESIFLQTSLDSSDNTFSERRISSETNLSPYFLKTMTPSTFEAALRQKDGELVSYMSRLGSLESIRDSLAEELVKMTQQCEKLQAEATALPSLRAELEALRRRHSAALELMGERDEELEELRADIIDLKEMYREQVDLLVNKINMINSASGVA